MTQAHHLNHLRGEGGSPEEADERVRLFQFGKGGPSPADGSASEMPGSVQDA